MPLAASIVYLVKNGLPELRESLDRVFAQDLGAPYEVLAIDSGSTDGSLEELSRRALRLVRIHPSTFQHGDTRNLGASLARADRVVFLTQDAIPAGEGWLRALLEPLDKDPRVAGAYSRMLPHEGARPLTVLAARRDLCFREEPIVAELAGAAEDPEAFWRLDPYQRRLLVAFNDVSSVVRKDVWRRIPFPRVEFGEDILWAMLVLQAGWKTAFAPRSAVRHSHEYGPRGAFARAAIDARITKRFLGRDCVGGWRDAWVLANRLRREDDVALRDPSIPRGVRFRERRRAACLHLATTLGFLRGQSQAGPLVKLRPGSRARLRVLLVVHGYPPRARAGTEICTEALARELSRRHDVAVLARDDTPELPDFSLHEEDRDGIRLHRLVHHLRFGSVEETYLHPRIDARFRQVLDRERPDVVHFMHAIHLSAGMLDAARARGIASVATLHDFWFLCPRVQWLRSDGKVCGLRHPNLGCLSCVKGHARWNGLLEVAGDVLAPLLRPFARHHDALAAHLPFLRHRHLADAAALYPRKERLFQRLRGVDLVLSPSRFLREEFVAAGLPEERILFSDNGLRPPPGAGPVAKTPSPRVRFAFLGSLVWYKGPLLLVQAFRDAMGGGGDEGTAGKTAAEKTGAGKAGAGQAERLDAELHVYGGAPDTEEGRRLEAELRDAAGGDPRIVLHGPVPQEELPRIHASTDVLVVPSLWYENSPLSIHEAFLYRTPVLTADRGGMADFVEEGRGGFRFRFGDRADLARRLRELARNPQAVRAAAQAFPAVKTIEEQARELEMRYRQILLVARPGGEGKARDRAGALEGEPSRDRARGLGPTDGGGRRGAG